MTVLSRIPALAAMAPRPFRVKRNSAETTDTFTLELEPDDHGPPPSFVPGQFNMLYAFGVGEVPISVSGDPTRTSPLVHTIRAVGEVTRALQRAKRGALIGVRGPYGNAWPVSAAASSDLLIIAGGIGLAPLRPVLYHALHHRSQYGKIVLLYGTRTPQDLLFSRELERWRGRFDLDVGVTVDRAATDWRGHVGVVTRLISRAIFDPASACAMICGPEIMMRFAVSELLRRGMDECRVFLSLERNMKCGIGLCGHCQCGPTIICRDGPVYAYSEVGRWLNRREI